MFLISQNEYYSIEHTKSELIKLLSQMRQEIAASRQSQTSMTCSHIEYCLEHLRNARSTIAVSLPVKSLDLEITSMLGQHILVLPPEARKSWDQVKTLTHQYGHFK